jgi:NTE family protein
LSIHASLPETDLGNSIRLLSKKLEIQPEAAESLLRQAEVVHLNRGDLLFSQGDPSFHFYLLLQGQLRGQRTKANGVVDLNLSFYPGELIGELGFFDKTLRTLSISARRDSLVLKVGQAELDRLGESGRPLYNHLIRILVSRFKREAGYGTKTAQHQFILFQSFLNTSESATTVRNSLLQEFSAMGEFRHWKKLADIPSHSELDPEKLTVELIETDMDQAMDERLLDELDSMVLLASQQSLADAGQCARLKSLVDTADNDLPVWLVLVHEVDAVQSNITGRARELLGTGFRIMHIRKGHAVDAARVARHILGKTVGLVLGGGGARGFAHAGFYRALEEAGVVIDSVGGTSMGALVAALISTGRNAADVIEMLAIHFRKGLPFRLTDYMLPRHGLVKGKAADRVYYNAFGELCIEDQPIPFFAVSCNLTTGNQFLFEHGPIWKAIRATTSIPVFFEPHVSDQQVMVDGALVNNVPVDCMRARGAHTILTVDVGQEADLTLSSVENSKVRLPSVMKSLMRVIELGGIEKSRQARYSGDFYVQPPIEKIGLMEFERREEIVALGYEAGQKAIPDILALLKKNT